MNNFECDREIKDKVIEYFKRKFEKTHYLQLDTTNYNNKYANADIKFTVINKKTGKATTYEIEIKERTGSTFDSFEDIMFEDYKMDYLLNEHSKGVRTYFLNVFNDKADAILFTVDDNLKYSAGFSYQYKYTEKKCNKKELMLKLYINKNQGRRINLND